MLSGKDLEGQASGFKQDNSSIEELETFMQGGKRGEVRRAINKITEKSLRPLMLIAGSLGTEATSSSTSAPPSSELEVLRAVSSAMAENSTVPRTLV